MGDGWRAVQEALGLVVRLAPFEILFADERGLHGAMISRTSQDAASAIEEIIHAIAPMAFDRIYPVPIRDRIVAEGRFQLWWS